MVQLRHAAVRGDHLGTRGRSMAMETVADVVATKPIRIRAEFW